MENKSKQNHHYTYVFALAGLVLADGLTKVENNEERKKKKYRVLRKKYDLIKEAFPEETKSLSDINDSLYLLKKHVEKDEQIQLIIDLMFMNPFAPYSLKFSKKNFESILKNIALSIGVSEIKVESLLSTKKAAVRSHIDYKEVALIGVGGAIVVGLGGFWAAPAVGGYLGAAAGLWGAAATAHGLALLGGGTLAAGGLGMAGGMWLMTGVGIAIGAQVGTGKFLLEIGGQQAKMELIKLQISYKEIILSERLRDKASKEKTKLQIESLKESRKEIQGELKEAITLNDVKSRQIKELKGTVKALDTTIDWMVKFGDPDEVGEAA